LIQIRGEQKTEEDRVNETLKFGPYLQESSSDLSYKDQLVKPSGV